MLKRICVFAGSSSGLRPEYVAAARDFAHELVARDLELVYGGAQVGLMGVLADSVLAANGRVIGVIPSALLAKEVAHPGLTELRVVASMHERKALMAELADGFVAVPGGLGTLEEFLEILTWAQLGMHEKPCGLFDVCGYYAGLMEFLDHCVRERFVQSAHRAMIVLEQDPRVLLDRFAHYRAPRIDKWIDRVSS